MSQQARARRRKPMADINVVPYIDVMLVLLVIFMVTAPMFNQGVQVDLPPAPAQPIREFMQQDEPFIVTIDQVGKIYINKAAHPQRAITLEKFKEIAPGMLAGQAVKTVYVKGDQNAVYGRVVKVMTALQNAGASSVGLISQPEAEQ